MKLGMQMPSLNGATDWFNGTAAQFTEAARGLPLLVHFWSISCEICKANQPRIVQLRAIYEKDGLRVLAIHMPCYEEDTDIATVQAAIAELKMTEPCAVDNLHTLRDAFHNEQGYVPAYYFFDAHGKLRSFVAGDRGLDLLAAAIEHEFKSAPIKHSTVCPCCNESLNHDARFCTRCGVPIARPQPQPPPPESPSIEVVVNPLSPRTEIVVLPQSSRTEIVALPQSSQTEIVGDSPRATSRQAVPTSGLLIGHVLDSKYELLECMGQGAMGAVYRARRLLIGGEVAVKILHRAYVSEPSALERFRREARAVAQLHHPNIVTIHDYGESQSDLVPAFLVMELLTGESLGDILQREGKLLPERAVALLRDVCAGVGAAHRHNIVHRDLKPDNIMVIRTEMEGDRELVKVVDFGIAKLRPRRDTRKLTQAGFLIGTPHYMSPEQCLGDDLGPPSDVYSLGAMAYEMLTGTPPFTDRSALGVMSKHLSETLPIIPAHLNIPAGLAAAVLRALAKSPEERQQDATELARELQSCLD